MNRQIRKETFDQAKKWIEEAGLIIKECIDDPLLIETKAHANDLVTEMDKQIELFFAKKIKEKYPTHLLLGEEGYGDDVTSLEGTIWIIDPIDGTTNFVHQKKNFAISVGIFHEGIGEIGFIYDVMADTLYSARRNEGAFKNGSKMEQLNKETQLHESIFSLKHSLLCKRNDFDAKIIEKLVDKIRGSRSRGSAALEIAQVAEGIVDGFIAKRLSPWDIAAGIIILNEVGGITTRSSGKTINMLKKGTIVSCNKVVHKELIENFLKHWKRDIANSN